MRNLLFILFWLAVCIPSLALEGTINIHDPSTVVKYDENYYVFGTGPGIPFLVSSNGFDWQRGGRVFSHIPDSVKGYVPKNNGTNVWAPDVIYLNGRYYVYYAVSFWGSFVSAVGLVTNATLDTNRADYKWTDCGMVVQSSQGQDLNAIDPGVCQAPDGTLWLCYGSYHGNIELVQLDPVTGLRIATNSPVSIIANQSEASDIIFHNGYYYLFVNHGSCCVSNNSTYNIRVGRSKRIIGPYLDRFGDDLVGGGGTLFLAAQGKDIGPGHFGRIIEDGVERFSCHYEAEIGRKGRSILDLRPLLWTTDDWPLPGDNLAAGSYQIMSLRSGTILQSTTNGALVQMGRYLIHPDQQWSITPAGGGCYKITNLNTANALTAGPEATLRLTPFTGAANQLWKIDQLVDGSYRIASPVDKLALAMRLKAPSHSAVVRESFSDDPAQHWVIMSP